MEIRKLGDIKNRTMQMVIVLLLAALVLVFPYKSQAATAGEINRDVEGALQNLYRTTPAEKKLAKVAKGILVFPASSRVGSSLVVSTARERFESEARPSAITILLPHRMVCRPAPNPLGMLFSSSMKQAGGIS